MALDTEIYEYNGIGRYVFGINAVEQAGAEAKRLTDGKNCLIITDPGVAKAGLVDKVKPHLAKEGFCVGVCTEVESEPTVPSIKAILGIARNKKSDVLVGLGGGSSMDTAKVIGKGLMLSDSLDGYVGQELEANGIPVVTIPTTSGTAAEVTPDCVVRLPEQNVKAVFLGVRATTAIVDPMMTLGLPPRLTAATGIDALAHAVESALSKFATPHTQAVAMESIRLICNNLREAVSNGSNLETRTKMAWGTVIEGFSEGNAGAVEAHAIGHIIGPYYGIHHGEACGIALPYCMEFNLPVNEEALVRIAEAIDKKTVNLAPQKAAETGIAAVMQLLKDVGLPSKLADIKNANTKDIPEMVEIYQTNPNIAELFGLFTKRQATKEEVTQLFINIFNGVLKAGV